MIDFEKEQMEVQEQSLIASGLRSADVIPLVMAAAAPNGGLDI